ncbi:MAG TPA: BTAD domain-containing putative transcriptional regulator [Longimicrobium sp.]|jgi:non-specific serine/threonine protein kinase
MSATRTADSLPVQLTSFVGRESEVAEVRRLLGSTRLLTLTGAGGSGKTRLALEAAAQAAGEYPHGVAWVELAPVQSPDLIPRQVAAALGVREEGGRPLVDVLLEVLRERSVLVVLDNCEHLVEACARLAELLLRGCPGVKVLATSREALGVAGERAWLVPGLALPGGEGAGLEDAAGAAAVRLFVERARDSAPDFRLTAANVPAVARICQRLDGLPLAIELAAARVRVLTPEQIAERLGDAFRLLTGGRRTAVPRQQTLRATMDWSYGLLSGREQKLLERLSVFAGGFTIDAAEAVCAGEEVEPFEVLDLLSALVDKSLVAMQEQGGAARCRLLETVRQYAGERLRQAGEEERWRRRHLEHFLALAEEAEPRLTGPEQGRWLARLEAEHDNFRTALRTGLETGDAEAAARLAGALARYWQQHGHLGEGRQWLAEALSAGGLREQTRAKALLGAGNLATRQRDYAASRPLLEESEALYRALDDRRMTGRVLNSLGLAAADQGDFARAEALYEQALPLLREAGDRWFAAMVLNNLGTTALRRRDFARAEALYGERLALAREMGDPAGAGNALNNLAATAYEQGDFHRAGGLVRESLPLTLEGGNVFMALLSLAHLAKVASATGDDERAARLFGAAEARLAAVGSHVTPVDREAYEHARAATRARLGEAAWERGWREGQALRLEQAVEFALAPAHAAGDVPADRPPASSVLAEASSDAGSDAAAAAPALVVRALGPLEIATEGEPLAPDAWTHARPRELLVFLLGHPQGRTREQVGLAFWPDASAAQVKNSFHVLLHRLRRSLGRPDWIVQEGERYRIAPGLEVWFDAAVFEREAAAALRDARSGAAGAEQKLRAALGLYRGDFLEGEAVGDWHLEVHDRLRRLYVDGLSALGGLLMERGDFAGAADVFERLVRREELGEDAHRRLMLCLARAGQRDRALRVYERLRALLRQELDAEPEAETAALAEEIRHGRLAASPEPQPG